MTFSFPLAFLPMGVADALDAFKLFFAFAIGHALGDFPLQGPFISRHKNRHVDPPTSDDSELPRSLWVYLLSAHSLVHAGFVWVITGSFALGIIEFLLHWIIDFAKSEKWTNFHADQFLHILSKVVYVVLIWAGIFS